MLSKYKVLLCIAICLSYEVVMTCCEVVWVNRNITDSFRVGEIGCKNNASVCNNAMCQGDGSCLCNGGEPNFRNPSFRIQNSFIVFNDTYGCLDSNLLRFQYGPVLYCYFGPFKVIPYNRKDPAEQFEYNAGKLKKPFENCTFIKTLIKFPGNATEMELPWLNESYVNFTLINTKLHLKWKRSVQVLQGTIITFILQCFPLVQHLKWQCLRAKVLGKWQADQTSTTRPSSTTGSSIQAVSKPITNQLTSITKSVTNSSPSRESACPSSSTSRGDPNAKIVVIAIVVPIVQLVVFVVVVWLLCRRIGRTGQGDSSHESSEKKNGQDNCEELSNYQSLQRDHLKDLSEEHTYQSLQKGTLQKGI